jgi:hypothetical protein
VARRLLCIQVIQQAVYHKKQINHNAATVNGSIAMIKTLLKPVLVGTLWATTLALSSVKAMPVTVQETGISPYEIVSITVPIPYSGGVYAGVNQLLVNGVLKNGFCIDPFHFSLKGPQPYNTTDLRNAPKDDHLIAGAHMTGAEAGMIRKLWTLAYSPSLTAQQAAGLQIAIWMVVGGSDFHLTSGNDYGAGLLLSQASAYSGPVAHLIALTGPGQDFVIATVPDNGTSLLLLGVALAGLTTFAWVKNNRPCLSAR